MSNYFGDMELVECDTVTALVGAPLGVRLRKLLAPLIGALVLFGPLALLGWWLAWYWLVMGAAGVGGLLSLAAGLSALRARVGVCPWCAQPIGAGAFDRVNEIDDQVRVECGHCFEQVVSHKGSLRAATQEERRAGDEHLAPLVAGASWPDECTVCGAPPTTHEDLCQRYSGLTTIASQIGEAGLLVPYCDEHAQQVAVVLHERRARLSFNDDAARRRYVAGNSGRRPIVVSSLG